MSAETAAPTFSWDVYFAARTMLIAAQERITEQLRDLERMIDESKRDVFLHRRSDGKHSFPTVVETILDERDQALRQRDDARYYLQVLVRQGRAASTDFPADPDDGWQP